MSSIELMGGDVQLYRRGDGKNWHCRASVGGVQHRTSTKFDEIEHAKIFAEDWYLTLRGKKLAGVLDTEKGPDFNKVADLFLKEYGVVTQGRRSPKWAEGHELRLRVHLRPFFGSTPVSKITKAMVRDYYVHRMTNYAEPNPHSKGKHKPKTKPPARNTLHNEIGTLSLALQTAVTHAWLDAVPDLSAPYKTLSKRDHRAWFSPEEYKQLYEAARAYAKEPQHAHNKWNAQQVYDLILFLANTGLRVDEAYNLEHRDVKVIVDRVSGDEILQIDVRGKVGTGYCLSTPSAVRPYRRLLARAKPVEHESRRAAQQRRKVGGDPPPVPEPEYPGPMDKVFPGNHIRLFNNLLDRTGLKFDRDGRARTAGSLRHTYISFRILEGAPLLSVANNCRTSVEMIEKHYAIHLRNMTDPSVLNVMKPKPKVRKKRPSQDDDHDHI